METSDVEFFLTLETPPGTVSAVMETVECQHEDRDYRECETCGTHAWCKDCKVDLY